MYSPCLVSVVHLANYIGFLCLFFWGGKVEVFCGLFQNNQLIFFLIVSIGHLWFPQYKCKLC